MSDYQVIARKFRPQTFQSVLGQEPIVKTLKNAMKFKRLGQAYLFCGSRGTGKTTLARIFAKALNCENVSEDMEPCNKCTSCREITQGYSLEVIEIDGASNRGIDDIRKINETIGYTTASGGYKIYIIDEVHMLTKEAFNALLKTLEEPPEKVKFFFATTEPHKVLPTILSRCQRFNLRRISFEKIVEKLQMIAQSLNIEVETAALEKLANQAEGALRDAESLFDQVASFSEGKISLEDVNSVLGLVSNDLYFQLDQAARTSDLSKAFQIAHLVFSEGKDIHHFLEGLLEHFRTILLIQLSEESFLNTSNSSIQNEYRLSATSYSQEQCLEIIEYLVNAKQQVRFASFSKINLEVILLYILQSRYRLKVGELVIRLHELEKAFHKIEKEESLPEAEDSPVVFKSPPISLSMDNIERVEKVILEEKIAEVPIAIEKKIEKLEPTKLEPRVERSNLMGEIAQMQTEKNLMDSTRPNYAYDTILQFTAIELNGKLQRH